MRRLASVLTRRRFQFRTLQSPEAPQRLGMSGRALFHEMRLLLADGRNLGGADAVVEIARRIWWAWPLWLLSQMPGARPLLHAAYRIIAANHHCIGDACGVESSARDQTKIGSIIALILPFVYVWGGMNGGSL